MERAKISPFQLFALIFLFELGSAIVVSLGIGAKKDAWLAILLGLASGMGLFFIYYYLFLQYPNLPFTNYCRKIFGKYLGWGIGLLYTIHFIYAAARNLRDFGDLLLASTLPKTPLFPINTFFILAIGYVLFLGIEVLGRTAEVFIVILLFLGVTGNLLVHLSGNVNYDHLMPILEEGWKPILTTTFPLITFFPFGEAFVFTMLLPYLNQPKFVKKVYLSALVSSGLILIYTASLNIAVLGVDRVERSTFPLLSTIGTVNIAEFLQRLDSIAIFTLIITLFFKIIIFYYAAIIGIVDLFQFKNYKKIVLPIGIIILYSSVTIASSFAEHIQEGQKIAAQYIHIPLHIILPFLMLVIVLIRKKLRSH
ncbi:GerAB/ArcD/ProY family transporter [Bacillus taeanensis]|uniref:Uncharacterized protein n=1 Tax=Bacillus taeanensis TaxID=273032 RepID=A0A366XTX9_9BACI|nr:GerAB/ArcD/ProY family transporter [Bacillus taeanensis]RBW69008.1 hypothetical protein DS031_13805 [Bacillus taeanensis]